MNPAKAQLINALRGPLIMITVGILFLLDNMTPLHFGETWPVILIVVGILALAGGGKRLGAPPPPGGVR